MVDALNSGFLVVVWMRQPAQVVLVFFPLLLLRTLPTASVDV